MDLELRIQSTQGLNAKAVKDAILLKPAEHEVSPLPLNKGPSFEGMEQTPESCHTHSSQVCICHTSTALHEMCASKSGASFSLSVSQASALS